MFFRGMRVLENSQCDLCACFGIGKRVVVAQQVESASCCYGREFVVGQRFAEDAACGTARAMKFVVRIVHAIALEHGFQSTFVEWAVVGHQR